MFNPGEQRNNNFDFLRLVFALSVIVTHSYTLTGLGFTDPLHHYTNRQVLMSFIGVSGFFTISGYLVYGSLTRSPNLWKYYSNRIRRIFPGFIVMLVLIVLFSSLLSSNPSAYFHSTSPYTYFLAQLSLFFSQQTTIAGVFEQNKIQDINISIWTISYEFLFYILLSVLIFFKAHPLFSRILLSIAFICCLFLQVKFSVSRQEAAPFSLRPFYIFYLGSYFVAGALLNVLNIKTYKYKNLLLILSCLLCILSLSFNVFYITKAFLLPVCFIIFGLASTPYISKAGKYGDFSYGIYIYAFFIQQVLIHMFHLVYWQVILAAIPLSIIFGFLSWHLVEKRFLKRNHTTGGCMMADL